MSKSELSRLLAICWWVSCVTACSSAGDDETGQGDVSSEDDLQAGASGADQAGNGGVAASGAAGVSGASGAGTAGSASGPGGNPLQGGDNDCEGGASYKVEGCPCQANETAACWTGPAADRNQGDCHDGLQLCVTNDEFSTWGPCMGEQLDCGEPPPDAGVPPEQPPPSGPCDCIPGAVVQCSEDCTAFIICSLTATKTCLPDKTWSPCREDWSVVLDPPGFQCRNMFHGCLNAPEDVEFAGQGEIYVGDCSKQFECGQAPSFL